MRNLRKYFIYCILFFFSSISQAQDQGLTQKGFALGLFAKEPQYSYENDLLQIKSWGATHVLLVVSWYQVDVKSVDIRPLAYDGGDILTLPDEKLREVIRQTNQLGLKAVVFPILRLEKREKDEWRGVLAPSDLEKWWKSYEAFVLHYAKIAGEEKADGFSVGSELLSREKETESWEKLISKVRSNFSGWLIYSANWDHYQHPQFWDKLDYIGMTAYHELSKTKKPKLKALKAKWMEIRHQILAWKKKHYPTKELVITEVGYPSIDGTSMYPWNYFLEGPVDLREQELCYKALYSTWKNVKSLSGVYFWVWWGEGGAKDNSYTPRGKPAEKWVKKWFLQ